jgi:hypothetical protein
MVTMGQQTIQTHTLVRLTSLKVSNFKMTEAMGLNIIALRSP